MRSCEGDTSPMTCFEPRLNSIMVVAHTILLLLNAIRDSANTIAADALRRDLLLYDRRRNKYKVAAGIVNRRL